MVDRVNVRVLLYVPVRSASLAPIVCLNPIVTLDFFARHIEADQEIEIKRMREVLAKL